MRSLARFLAVCAALLSAQFTAATYGDLVLEGGTATLPVSMSNDGSYAQTTVFAGELYNSSSDWMKVTSIYIRDSGSMGGANGVFSGFDLDFIYATNQSHGAASYLYASILSATLTPGAIRYPVQSPYRPTALHPGILFGLKADGSIDYGTASLNTMNASYLFGKSCMSVDTSSGWVSLGDGGTLKAVISPVMVAPLHSLYLQIGEVGLRDEFANATVEIEYAAYSDGNVIQVDAGGPYVAHPATGLNLSASENWPYPIVSYTWSFWATTEHLFDPNNPNDINTDALPPSADGHMVGSIVTTHPDTHLSYSELVSEPTGSLGLHPGSFYWVRLQVESLDGSTGTDWARLYVNPEPATLAMFCAGGAWLLSRRRRARRQPEPAR